MPASFAPLATTHASAYSAWNLTMATPSTMPQSAPKCGASFPPRLRPGAITATTSKKNSPAAVAVPPSGGRLTANKPNVTSVQASGPGSGGALVQLGSFPTEAAANAEWAAKSRRFAYLAPLGKSVEKAEVNGRTMYRLRVNAGSAGAASTLCGKLKVAGEACFIPN